MGFILPVPSSDNPAEYAKALIARKGALETELDSQFSVLSANTSTMSSPLLDSEGFPRADIDVYAVRHARVRIIQLRNDLKEVMDQIAKALEGVYQRREGANDESGPSGEGGAAVNEDEETGLAEEEAMKPFARVDGVAPGSPAADAVSDEPHNLKTSADLYRGGGSHRGYDEKTLFFSLERSPSRRSVVFRCNRWLSLLQSSRT